MNQSSMPMVARCIISTLTLLAAPVSAAVVTSSPAQFTLGYTATVKATPDQTWATVVNLPGWWSPAHSYSGKAANLSIDARAGGCWCERWTGPKGEANSIEHARIVMAMPGKVLRAVGGFGPLQQAPVYAVLSIEMKPIDGGTQLRMVYAASGDIAGGMAEIAPAIDGVLGQQFDNLVKATVH
ncbi:SRPBCC domain-containing protein [Polymorphobacter arshaanensis]|uniref:SRPBCC domain-containing protein n=1 Tax=Glacieibacterium arshaanense TaxID=2511025 RepID=A0A4Y9ESE8_9SPHN|nr:SRPBCC domain-containing protein [Polymorphobacter arshaanensis]TFU06555.1 SRPBCC domain-containing protein [Polymorphobacter arshaanensis]